MLEDLSYVHTKRLGVIPGESPPGEPRGNRIFDSPVPRGKFSDSPGKSKQKITGKSDIFLCYLIIFHFFVTFLVIYDFKYV